VTRCNPYGYGTDAGPKHLAGGRYGPEYAGDKNLIFKDGVHGLGVCETPADRRVRMVCTADQSHRGPTMDVCGWHAGWISTHYTRTCTRCAMPGVSIELEHAMEATMRDISAAMWTGDLARARALQAHLDDQRQQMDEMITTGVIRAAVPLRLVEVS
jgi:hypothetical protein